MGIEWIVFGAVWVFSGSVAYGLTNGGKEYEIGWLFVCILTAPLSLGICLGALQHHIKK